MGASSNVEEKKEEIELPKEENNESDSNELEDVESFVLQEDNIEENNIYYSEVYKSICKIIIHFPQGDKVNSGFFIKLFKGDAPFYGLMTNAQFINKDIIKENGLKRSIEIHYDNLRRKSKIKIEDLIQEDRFFEDFRYLNIDATLIEILPKENLKEEFFLLPNDSVTSESTKLEDKKIFIPTFSGEGILTFCEGTLKKINKYEFLHNVDTKTGLSGSSVFLDKTTTSFIFNI